jgi:hypothetical protein
MKRFSLTMGVKACPSGGDAGCADGSVSALSTPPPGIPQATTGPGTNFPDEPVFLALAVALARTNAALLPGQRADLIPPRTALTFRFLRVLACVGPPAGAILPRAFWRTLFSGGRDLENPLARAQHPLQSGAGLCSNLPIAASGCARNCYWPDWVCW